MDKKIGRGSSNNAFYNDDHKWDSQDSSHFDNKCCIHIENKNESKKSINKEKMDSDKNKRVKSEKNKVDGLSYWWDVFVCFVINVCIQTIESFVDIGIHDQRFLRTFDVNETEVQQVNNYFKSMIDFFAPIGVFVMTKFGQRTNIVAGSLLICASFTGISFLDSRSVPHSVWYWKIGICGPAGFGISLLKIGALVPVLEYFTKRRMEALLLTKVGFVLGYVIDMGAKFAGTLHWTTLYRINAGLCAFPLVFIFKKKVFMIKVCTILVLAIVQE
ncbi:monocarboxylate transporter 7-like [Ruditapes philippinarum]|uniref:monocarboxylate transporter 7-like n=1 Tax=Ruditapes philippinarum TaxID=129788 RepID=UPI00295A9251|nr:monocarboxylate transporter 7-like [Ruditapes philippinarum]